jgi:hypothetical protein
MVKTKRIDDLIVLGRAGPEPIKDGWHTVCLGGYSPIEGYIRLYPTQKWMRQLKRWNVISIPVESGDYRDESYKIAGSKNDWENLHKKVDRKGRLNKKERIHLIDSLDFTCRNKLNDNRLNLGVVEPKITERVYLEENPNPQYQIDLSGKARKSKNSYPHKLYIDYVCEGCEAKNGHTQHCIEWGIYQYWEKHDDPEKVIDALKILDEDWKSYFFIGNLKTQPTAYVVISVLRFKKEDMLKHGIRTDEQSGLADYS